MPPFIAACPTKLALPLFLVPAFARPCIPRLSPLRKSPFACTAAARNASSLNNILSTPYQWLLSKTKRKEDSGEATLSAPVKAKAKAKARPPKFTPSMKARLRRRKRNLALASQARDKNKQRGISAIHSTGPRYKTGIYKYPLPVPVIDPEKRAQFGTREDHGLWGFFNKEKQPMVSGEEEAAFGRAWAYHELQIKSFEDLHALYWTTILEINRTQTRRAEMKRVKAGYGDYEAKQRIQACWETNKNIKLVLADRHANFVEAASLHQKGRVGEALNEDVDDDQEGTGVERDYFMEEGLAKEASDAVKGAARR